MANRTTRTPTKDDKFFTAVAEGSPIGDACRAAGYSRTSVYSWRDADDEFAARWREAIEEAVERMEAEADRRAVEGTERPVFYKGGECGAVREYSDTLLIFRLKALKPDMYRERASVEHTGRDGKDLIPSDADPTRMAVAILAVLRGGASEEKTDS